MTFADGAEVKRRAKNLTPVDPSLAAANAAGVPAAAPPAREPDYEFDAPAAPAPDKPAKKPRGRPPKPGSAAAARRAKFGKSPASLGGLP